MEVKRIIVIGCGLHFKERHYAALCSDKISRDISIELVVDLISQEEKINNFFSDKTLKPKCGLFLPDCHRNSISADEFDEAVMTRVNLCCIDAVLICTEPKVHKPYALWAIAKGIPVFSDKPLTAFSSARTMDTIYDDYAEIQSAVTQKQVRFDMCCERRGHLGYRLVMNEIAQLINRYRIPITHVSIHYGDGLWIMPDEYLLRENHPYKYGYGVLLHSGYHYIDLLVQLVSLNNILSPLLLDNTTLSCLMSYPDMALKTVPNTVYQDIFSTNRFSSYFEEEARSAMLECGETDAIITGRFQQESGSQTTFNLNLFQTTVSQRSWDKLPENTYLQNGRTHLESLIVHLGNLCTIEININPFLKQKVPGGIVEDFSVRLMKNAGITGDASYTSWDRQTVSDIFPELLLTDSMNITSRAKQLTGFLKGDKSNTSLSSHRNSIFLLNKIFKSIKCEKTIDVLEEADCY